MTWVKWIPIAWLFGLVLFCGSAPVVAQSGDSLFVRYVPHVDAYHVPRSMLEDYLVCASEVEALQAVEMEAARLVAVQDSLVGTLRSQAAIFEGGAVACSRAMELSQARAGALGAEVEAWRAAAIKSERTARTWMGATLVIGGVGFLIVLLR